MGAVPKPSVFQTNQVMYEEYSSVFCLSQRGQFENINYISLAVIKDYL